MVLFQDTRNPRLRENVLLGMITPGRLAVMTPHEMASDEMKELRAKLTKEAIDDHQMAQQGRTKSDFFKCSRCGQRDTTYNQVNVKDSGIYMPQLTGKPGQYSLFEVVY